MHFLDTLFAPDSVALIGASSDPERIGGRPLRFLIEGGFAGKLYPINRSGAAEIQGLKSYASLLDVPGPVDHAIIAVPVAGVEAALLECARKGVRVVQVFTADGPERPEVRLSLDAGSDGLRRYGVQAAGQSCSFNYVIDHSDFSTDGWRVNSAAQRQHTNANCTGLPASRPA